MRSIDSENIHPGLQTYVGVFLLIFSTLIFELLLTRVFSVTMWYHFAFVAVSLAMFGMTVGALIVYLAPDWFKPEVLFSRMAVCASLFGITALGALVTHLYIPFSPGMSLRAIASVAITYGTASLPFIFSGICICLALTRFPRQVGRIYAVDLIGAALGCLALIQLLQRLGATSTAMIVSSLGLLAGFSFDWRSKVYWRRIVVLLLALGTMAVGMVEAQRSAQGRALLPLRWAKGRDISQPLFEKWNSFSLVRVYQLQPDIQTRHKPFDYDLSANVPIDQEVRQLNLVIDADASTLITEFDGDLKDIQYLRNSICSMVHYVRPNANVLVIGAGGGRDILTALQFGQKSVTGIEINNNIVEAVNDRFGRFSGNLPDLPNVEIVSDEARSYIARQDKKYDIIQLSLVDTAAATAAGAYVLTENSLYTTDAWQVFYEHLTPGGVMSFTRWHYEGMPGEILRLTSLAVDSLRQAGIQSPRKHMAIILFRKPGTRESETLPDGLGTLLVSKTPFSDEQIDILERETQRLGFEILLSPRSAKNSTIAALASNQDFDRIIATHPLNISPPTDNTPFFFNMLRFRDMLDRSLWQQGFVSYNMKAVFTLGALLIVMVGLTCLCIFLPLVLTRKRVQSQNSRPFLVYFAAIGLGFMLVEISQIQRLIILLGHPTYGLSVALFALLLSSGIGSWLSGPGTTKSGTIRFAALLSLIAAFGLITPIWVKSLEGTITPVRIAAAVAALFPMGLFMGMCFPLGMRAASRFSPTLTPWLWGINGATSVCGSALAVAIALASGIATSFWTGFACYICACLMWFKISHSRPTKLVENPPEDESALGVPASAPTT